MEIEPQRSGVERREQENAVPDDRRQTPERRVLVHDAEQIIEFMKKIPLFKKPFG